MPQTKDDRCKNLDEAVALLTGADVENPSVQPEFVTAATQNIYNALFDRGHRLTHNDYSLIKQIINETLSYAAERTNR